MLKLDFQPLREFRAVIKELNRADRVFLNVYIIIAAGLSLLDMIALGLVALVLTPLMSNQPVVLPVIGLVEPPALTPYLIAVVVLLGGKNALMLILSKAALGRLSKVEITLSRRILAANLTLPWALRADKPVVDIMRAADYAVLRTIVTFMYPALGIPAMLASIVAMTITLIILQPVTALTTVLFFGLVGLLMNTLVSKRASKVGAIEQSARNRTNALMLEMLNASKELILRNKIKDSIEFVSDKHGQASRAFAQYTFLAQSARPLLEIALLLGAVVIGAVNFALGGLEASISAIALFGIAGFRLAPSIATLQSDLVAIRVASPYVQTVLSELGTRNSVTPEVSTTPGAPTVTNRWNLGLEGVSYSYPQTPNTKVLDRVSLTVPHGSRLALVGPSGSGKSTLVDVILGLLEPVEGRLLLDSQDLGPQIDSWQRSIGYVPQQVTLFDASIAQNVALTWDDEFDESSLLEALTDAQLLDVVKTLPQGIHTNVGEGGLLLSGGQRQRLGIARALYTKPLVLVLDEATSALDNATENEISQVIERMDKSITVITIAHRLSTIANYDQICFLKDGKVAALGTFEELVQANKEFAKLARLGSISG